MANKVKGIKYGPWAKYAALSEINPDVLYFITDKGGTVYRGSELVIPSRVIESINTGTTTIGNGTQYYYSFEIEAFNSNSAGATGTPSAPTKYSFDVYNKEAVDAIRTVLMNALQQHDAKLATNEASGHVWLTDDVNLSGSGNPNAASGYTAVTPEGVYKAISEAIGGIGGAMVFKGTIGSAGQDPEPTVTSLPTNNYEAGWTYRVVTAGTYASKTCEVGDLIISVKDGPSAGTTVIDADWTVAQTNIDGAVTVLGGASGSLTTNTVILGAGTSQIKSLENGSNGQYLRIQNGVPTWVNHPNADHGIAKCTCSTDFINSSNNGTATMVDSNAGTYKLVSGAIVAVAFTNMVSNKLGDVTLNVESTGAKLVYFRGAKIAENIIKAGETGTFMYNGTYWDLLAVDKKFADVAISGDYDDLDHKAIIYATNSESASTTARTLTLNDYTEGSTRLIAVKFTNGIIFNQNVNPTLRISNDSSSGTAKAIKWHGNNLKSSEILAGDTAIIINDGSYYNILSIDRQIDENPTSGSTNLVTSGGVYNAIQESALWWEPLT